MKRQLSTKVKKLQYCNLQKKNSCQIFFEDCSIYKKKKETLKMCKFLCERETFEKGNSCEFKNFYKRSEISDGDFAVGLRIFV